MCDTTAIQKLSSGTAMTGVAGHLVQVDTSDDGSQVWGINDLFNIYQLVSGSFTQVTGQAGNISVGHDGTVTVIGVENLAGGGKIYKRSGSSWSQLGSGTGIMVRCATSSHILSINSRGDLFRWNGTSWTKITPSVPSGQVFAVWSADVADDGTIYCQTTDGKLWTRSYTASSWTQIGTATYDPLYLQAASSTLMYALKTGSVYSYDGTSFAALAHQPASPLVQMAYAHGSGDLFGTDLAYLHKYSGGTWTASSTVTNMDCIAAGGSSAGEVWGLSYGDMCTPASPTNNPLQMLLWGGKIMDFLYAISGNHPTTAWTDTASFLGNYKSGASNVAANGTSGLPSFSNFQSMVTDYDTVLNDFVNPDDTYNWEYFLYDPSLDIPNLGYWTKQNAPSVTTDVQIVNFTDATVLQDFMNTILGIGNPSINNSGAQGGWLDYVTDSNFGTTTSPEAVSEIIAKTIVTNWNSFKTTVLGATSYSTLTCADLQKAFKIAKGLGTLILCGATLGKGISLFTPMSILRASGAIASATIAKILWQISAGSLIVAIILAGVLKLRGCTIPWNG